MADPVVTTTAGRVRGHDSGGVSLAWKGIPYAAPPFGENRFGPPVPPARWDGVRDGRDYGPTVPKPPYRAPFDQLIDEPVIPGDDCLNLNVWSPDPGAGGLPVMVWVHGGAFRNGSGAIPTYSGHNFARDGVVCVTINYRLGCEGFLHLDDAPANRGMLDQVAALRWVQDNIAAFGGDPGNVTIFGESAGGMSVTTLMAMPAARGMFRRVIAQSGAGHHALTSATARLVTEELGRRLGVEPNRAGFATVDPAELVAAQSRLAEDIALDPQPARWREIVPSLMPYQPVIDGESLPALPIEAIRGGACADVDVLTGTTRDEFRFFTVPTGIFDAVTDPLLESMAAARGLSAEGIALYRKDAATPGDAMVDMVTDWFFRIPAVRLAETRWSTGTAAHMYEFTWPTPAWDGRLRACHALELGFVFDTLADRFGFGFFGDEPPQEIADEMHAAWVGFATGGDPGWPGYEAGRRATRIFGPGGPVVDDPRAQRRRAWDGIR